LLAFTSDYGVCGELSGIVGVAIYTRSDHPFIPPRVVRYLSADKTLKVALAINSNGKVTRADYFAKPETSQPPKSSTRGTSTRRGFFWPWQRKPRGPSFRT